MRQQIQSYTKSGGGGTVPVGLGRAAGGIFFIVDAPFTRQKGYDVQISFPKEGIGSAAECIALVKGNKNTVEAKKLIDWAASPDMQSLLAPNKINFLPANAKVAPDPDLAAILKNEKIIEIDDKWAGENRKRIVERWVAEVLNAEEGDGARSHDRGPCAPTGGEGGRPAFDLAVAAAFRRLSFAMLLQRAVFDDGGALAGGFHRSAEIAEQGGRLQQPGTCGAGGLAGTAIGFVFAFTVERGGQACGVVAVASRSRDIPAAGSRRRSRPRLRSCSFGPRGFRSPTIFSACRTSRFTA